MADTPEWYARTQSEVAAFFGVQTKTVATWRDWIPKRTPKGYDLSAIAIARFSRIQGEPEQQRTNVTVSLRQRKLQIEDENWRKKKLENDQRAGELLPRAEVQAELSRWAARFPGPLLSLANELANRVPGTHKAEAMKWATERIHAALAEVREQAVAGVNVEEAILEEADRIRAGRRKVKRRPAKKTKKAARSKKPPKRQT